MEHTITIHGRQAAEQVTFGELKPNTPFYLDNPLQHINARVHYTCEDFDPLTPVWVIFSTWELERGINPWIVSEPTKSTRGVAAALFGGLDHNLCA